MRWHYLQDTTTRIQKKGIVNTSLLELDSSIIFSLDFAYLAGTTNISPLANTLRFGLQVRFGNKSKW
ncbi:hypothetical protein HDC90_004941 [Pedobacter sp. AK013]|nr:hypothetical protein [Pedobacter sp. AK013]